MEGNARCDGRPVLRVKLDESIAEELRTREARAARTFRSVTLCSALYRAHVMLAVPALSEVFETLSVACRGLAHRAEPEGGIGLSQHDLERTADMLDKAHTRLAREFPQSLDARNEALRAVYHAECCARVAADAMRLL